MKDSKPTVIAPSNPIADGIPMPAEQEIQFENVRLSLTGDISNAGGPKNLLASEDDDPIREFIKDHLPRYKAPTDLKDKIRSITSFKEEDR